MAYTEPTQKAHGDDPTIAMIQVYADNCDAIAALALAIQNSADSGVDVEDSSDEYATFSHRGAWLLYATEIQDEDNKKSAELFPYRYMSDEEDGLSHTVGEPSTLSDAPDGDAYNLDEGVNWLIPGRLYQIDNVRYAFEVTDFTG